MRDSAAEPSIGARQPKEHTLAAKVLVLYDSSYGHIETMAGAIAEGAPARPAARLTRG